MARTFTRLWPQIVSWDNIILAYRKCRRGKRYQPPAFRFDFQWEQELLTLQNELASGEYIPGKYRHFEIRDPKPRRISAAPFRDRVVHHALVNVLEPIFEPKFVHDSYACRRGKGTHRAIDRAQGYLRRHRYYLKTDIVRFFPNVDHEVMFDVLGRTIADPRVMALIKKILDSGTGVLTEQATKDYFEGDDLFAVLRPKGLPIGNLTSQFFANVILNPIDHFVKEELRVPGYVRYADDLVLFGDDKRLLQTWHRELATRLCALRLRLHRDKTVIRPTTRPLAFLGLVIDRVGRRLTQEGIRRFGRRLRKLKWQFQQGQRTPAEIRMSLSAWLAHCSHANTKGLRRDLWKRIRFSRSN